MPYPRFGKLAQAKRERLLEVAAQEIAAHGFEAASINRILARAEMSKGAAYYYFEDKVDLIFAVVQYCDARLKLFDRARDSSLLTAATFWPTFAELHREPLLRSFEQPWLFAAAKAAGHLAPEALAREPLATFVAQSMAWVLEVVKRGQELGVIRSDVPDDLLFAWLVALDDAGDQWLLARWERLTRQDIARVSDQVVDAMRRAVAPVDPTVNA
jgi:AcrR family transcriptional regulator